MRVNYAVFAVRLDSFALAKQSKFFISGSNDQSAIGQLKNVYILKTIAMLAEVGEYLTQRCF